MDTLTGGPPVRKSSTKCSSLTAPPTCAASLLFLTLAEECKSKEPPAHTYLVGAGVTAGMEGEQLDNPGPVVSCARKRETDKAVHSIPTELILVTYPKEIGYQRFLQH